MRPRICNPRERWLALTDLLGRMMNDELQQVFRVGCEHNKWIVVLPKGVTVSTDVTKAVPEIVRVLKERFGNSRITTFDHVEYLGRG